MLAERIIEPARPDSKRARGVLRLALTAKVSMIFAARRISTCLSFSASDPSTGDFGSLFDAITLPCKLKCLSVRAMIASLQRESWLDWPDSTAGTIQYHPVRAAGGGVLCF
jgi:hypothetical protein